MKRVSAIIPSYNYGKFIGEAIASVQAQTYRVFEIIVVDDGSTDDTQEILAQIHDERLTVIRTENLGVSNARNVGLAASKGEFIAFLDADDRWSPTKTEMQLALLDAEPTVGAVFSNFRRFDANGYYSVDQFAMYPELKDLQTAPVKSGPGKRIVGDAFSMLVTFEESPIYVQSLLFRREVVTGLEFDPALRICQDLHFCLRAFWRTSVAFLEEPLLEVRRHGANATRKLSEVPYGKLKALRALRASTDSPRRILNRQQTKALSRRTGHALMAVGIAEVAEGRKMAAFRAFVGGSLHTGTRVSAAVNIAMLIVPPLKGVVNYLRARRRSVPTSSILP